MKRTQLVIERTWNGIAVGEDERVVVDLELGDTALSVGIDAPFHNDAAPDAPAGSLDGLWDFEVVEVFLLGAGDAYLELEFGPHGHYLVLQLEGYRQVRQRGLSLDYTCTRSGPRWSGRGGVPHSYLPSDLNACNAYAIHGAAEARRYLAACPPGGPEPDFHRLERFSPLEWL